MTKLASNMLGSKPKILCLHGGGTSAAIFYAQTRKIRSTLGSRFEFIFADAPIKSGPGPGVLPYFEDSGPYYCWFSSYAALERSRLNSEIDAVNEAIETSLRDQRTMTTDIVGVLGFSQGTIAASLLLWQMRRGDAKWANLRFGVMLCGGGGGDIRPLIGDRLQVPSVHVHGLDDPFLPDNRMLAECYHPDTATIMEFEGGHHVPTRVEDIKLLSALMIEASMHRPAVVSAKTITIPPASLLAHATPMPIKC